MTKDWHSPYTIFSHDMPTKFGIVTSKKKRKLPWSANMKFCHAILKKRVCHRMLQKNLPCTYMNLNTGFHKNYSCHGKTLKYAFFFKQDMANIMKLSWAYTGFYVHYKIQGGLMDLPQKKINVINFRLCLFSPFQKGEPEFQWTQISWRRVIH